MCYLLPSLRQIYPKCVSQDLSTELRLASSPLSEEQLQQRWLRLHLNIRSEKHFARKKIQIREWAERYNYEDQDDGHHKYLHEVQMQSQWIFRIASEAFKVKQDSKDITSLQLWLMWAIRLDGKHFLNWTDRADDNYCRRKQDWKIRSRLQLEASFCIGLKKPAVVQKLGYSSVAGSQT